MKLIAAELLDNWWSSFDIPLYCQNIIVEWCNAIMFVLKNRRGKYLYKVYIDSMVPKEIYDYNWLNLQLFNKEQKREI